MFSSESSRASRVVSGTAAKAEKGLVGIDVERGMIDFCGELKQA